MPHGAHGALWAVESWTMSGAGKALAFLRLGTGFIRSAETAVLKDGRRVSRGLAPRIGTLGMNKTLFVRAKNSEGERNE
jgi:hypothetical protein